MIIKDEIRTKIIAYIQYVSCVAGTHSKLYETSHRKPWFNVYRTCYKSAKTENYGPVHTCAGYLANYFI